jgi:DNA-binding transcriptional LysR family regulator
MKIDQLTYFLRTAETQHIRKAAHILNVSPSAISHSLAALEDELGQILFEKVGKSICLTEHGKRLAARIAPVLHEFERIRAEMRSPESSLEGHYKIAVTHGLGSRSFLRNLSKLQIDQPGVSIEFYSLRSAEVISEVTSGHMDLGYCYAPTANAKISVLREFNDRLAIAVRKGHPLLRLDPHQRTPALSSLPYAAAKAFLGVEICEAHPVFQKVGIDLKTSFIFDSYEVAAEYLRHSPSWALMPESLIRHYDLEVVEIPNWNESTRACFIAPSKRPLPKAIAEWVLALPQEI